MAPRDGDATKLEVSTATAAAAAAAVAAAAAEGEEEDENRLSCSVSSSSSSGCSGSGSGSAKAAPVEKRPLIPRGFPYSEDDIVNSNPDRMKEILDRCDKKEAEVLREIRRKMKNRVRKISDYIRVVAVAMYAP